MATWAQIRDGIADQLDNISGLNVYRTLVETPTAPCVFILPPWDKTGWAYIKPNGNFPPGIAEFQFEILIFADKSTDYWTYKSQLGGYISPTGSTSVRAAIEADRTLGGVAHDAKVERVENVDGAGSATFRVQVIA